MDARAISPGSASQRKFQKVPPFTRGPKRAKEKLNRLIHPLNEGIIISPAASEFWYVEQLPSGQQIIRFK